MRHSASDARLKLHTADQQCQMPMQLTQPAISRHAEALKHQLIGAASIKCISVVIIHLLNKLWHESRYSYQRMQLVICPNRTRLPRAS